MEIIEEQRTKPRQAPGQLLSIAGLGLLTGALVEVGRTGWSAPRTVDHWPLTRAPAEDDCVTAGVQ